MAISYQAKIDLIVAGLGQIETAEKRIKSLLRESRKLQRGGIAQRGTAALAATTREGRQQSRRQVRNAERRLELQSKLNSATDLYNRKLQQFQRAGGAGNKQLQGRVDQITQAFAVGTKEGTKNLRLTRALATELGRVVEQQRELNRARAQGNKGFEAGRRGFERIEALRASGFGSERQISGAESLVRKIGPAAASGDQAAFNEAVRKAEVALRRLEREFQQAERAQRESTKAKRDVERAERKLANEAEKDARDRANRRKKRFQDIATGAGFPLLFGGGPAQALAGGIGGAFGGLGGSIAASAIVSQVEVFAQETAKVGQALGSVSGSFDLMSEKALFTSDETQLLVQAMIEQGDAAGAARKMTEELAKKIGQSGIKKLKEFGDEAKKLGGLVNTLILRFQAFIANALTPLLKFLNSALGATDTRQRFAQLRSELTGDRKTAFEARLKQLGVRETTRGTKGLQGKGGLEKMRTLLEEFPLESIQVAGGQITPSAADLAAADKGGEKAAREEARIQQRLAALEVERQKILEISRFKDKIAAAEAVGDAQLVIRLQGEQRVAQIEAKRLADLTRVKDQRVIDAININAATEKLAAQRETERQITEEQRRRQELFETTIQGLEHQLEMTEATSQAERDRLKIARELKKLDKKGLKGDQLTQAQGLMERLAVAQQPLNAFIRKTTEDLNNLQQVAVDVSQGIGNAIGSSLVNGLQSLVTGAASIKEVFANMLKSVADVLANTAAKMIAQYIAIGIARMFAGMGGGSEGNGLNLTAIEQYSGIGANTPVSPGIAGAGVGGFAEGGYVSGPTRALVGEGGEPEYIIPESKMRESMSRYSRGARGGSVIPETGVSGASSEGGGTAVAAPIDVRYTVERINNVDYVTADQFQAGMRQAANQGAKQGEQQTLKRLQMSSGTRKRLGM